MPNEYKQIKPLIFSANIVLYLDEMTSLLKNVDVDSVAKLRDALYCCWRGKKTVFLIGNGGSEANATHLANDLIYGLGKMNNNKGLRAISLSSNTSISTAIANDEGYEFVYSKQLETLAEAGDLLLVFSGSGNSKNIISCLKAARKMGVKTAGFLGFDGGASKKLLDICIHTQTYNMQLSEDLQIILGHAISRDLSEIAASE